MGLCAGSFLKHFHIKKILAQRLWEPSFKDNNPEVQEDPLEEVMVIHSSILAWRIPWREEPGGLQSMGLQGVGHD